MKITEVQLKLYKEIHKEESGQDIDDEKAMEELTALVTLLSTVYDHMKAKGWELSGKVSSSSEVDSPSDGK